MKPTILYSILAALRRGISSEFFWKEVAANLMSSNMGDKIHQRSAHEG